jgi:riboflavin transporter FmnP
MEKNNYFSTKRIRWMTLVGMMSALTYIVYLPIFRIPVILFLELNLSEVVIFIGGFSLGPIAAIMIGLFRFLFSLLFSTTGGIGELADYLYSMAFVLPGVILYQYHRDKRTASLGFIIGFISQLAVTSILNALVITDLYLSLFLNLTPEAFLGYIQSVLPQVENPYWSLVLWMYLPFNIFKNLVIIALTLLTYKRTHHFIKKFR